MKISGEKLAAARESAKITRADLAVAADLSHVRIWQLESELVSNVNSNIVKAMADVLKVVTEDLQA